MAEKWYDEEKDLHTPSRLVWSDDSPPEERVQVQEKYLDTDVEMHWHEFFEVEIVLGGSGEQILNGTRYPLRQGSVTLLNPTDFHCLSINGELHLLHICFDETRMAEHLPASLLLPSQDVFLQTEGEAQQELFALGELLHGESRRRGEYHMRYLWQLLDCLLILLLRERGHPAGEKQGEHSPIRAALLYLNLHFRTSPSLAQTAKIAGQNPTYFSECFHRETGCSYVQYLTELRLRYACTLLRTSELPVTDICYACGFNSLSHFERVFRRTQGCSPTVYRGRA